MSGWPHIVPRTRHHMAVRAGSAVSRQHAYQAGTVLGLWTVAEMTDYAAAVRYVGAQISAWSCPAWNSSDPAAYSQWQQDRVAAINQANDALHVAKAKIAATPSSLQDVWPAGDAWDGLVSAMTALNSVYLTAAQASGCAPPDISQMPQPTASDIDISVYKGTANLVPSVDNPPLPNIDWGTIKFGLGVTALVVILYFLHPLIVAAGAAATAHATGGRA